MLAKLLLVGTLIATPLTAESAVLMEENSGRVLYEKNPHKQMKIASITKIMTAILAIESGKMEDTVTIDEKIIQTEGSSLYLKAGEQWKIKDLVYGLMLRSGNDAALVIANHIGGSVEGFVYLMNEKAGEIGMSHTHFANPHGLDHPEHFSTAYDMALLTKYAMQNPVYQEISQTKNYRQWENKNKLLHLYPYITGGKTGFTKKSGRTLVTTAEKEGLALIAVTINDPNDWHSHIHLFDEAFQGYQKTTILSKGQRKFGIIKHDFVYPLTTEEQRSIHIKYQAFHKKKNGKIGIAEIYLGEKKIGERGIYPSFSI